MFTDRVRTFSLVMALVALVALVPTPAEASQSGYTVSIVGPSSFSVPAFSCVTKSWRGYGNLYTTVYSWYSNGQSGTSQQFNLTFCNFNPKTYITSTTQTISLTASTTQGGLTCSTSKTITVVYASSGGLF